ncbi:dipeptidase [Lapillicoccus sp.]|uniref:dipeptidase n=1 Tax=Lapillicoccus sp. TaxID=1909287 RepID=UPI00326416A4
MPENADHADLEHAVDTLMPQARADLARLVAFRSVAGAEVEAVSECRSAAEHVADLLRELGIGDVRLLETVDGSIAVVGRTEGPPGAPRVLLYSHYDVQPVGNLDAWGSDPWTLTEREGRWYARGAADCKGNLVMHLTALRALGATNGSMGGGGDWPVALTIVCEGSEEMSTGGLVALVGSDPGTFVADVVVVADSGNVEAGMPTVTTSLRGTGSVLVTVRTLQGPVHSGAMGGPAPDALAALVHVLATLRDDAGNTVVSGLDASGSWTGAAYPAERFRSDAGVLEGVGLLGTGSIADSLWARPVATILAIDAPSVQGASASIQPEARALVNLRVPPGVDAAAAQQLLVAHLESAVPWGTHITVEPKTLGQPFAARTDGPAFAALGVAMEEAFGSPMVETGQGGAIPLCTALSEAHPDAEILLIGVEEPACRIHAPDESVSPDELRRTAFAEALFLRALGSRS